MATNTNRADRAPARPGRSRRGRPAGAASAPSRARVAALLGAGGLAVAGGLVAAASPAAPAPGAPGVTVQHWVRVGVVTFSRLAPDPAPNGLTVRVHAAVNRSLSPHPPAGAPDRVAGFAPPVVAPTPVLSSTPGFQRSWEGSNALTEATANTVQTTPPDQGLCAGNGFVVEIVNDAVRVFHPSGSPASATVPTNAFFGLPPEFNPKTGRLGPIPTDPTCTYDPSIGRWFVDVVVLATHHPKTGAPTFVNKATLAVSRTSDPLGAYAIYQLDLTDTHAGGRHVGCPCRGEFPKIAVDGHGLYLSTNEYPLAGDGFYGNGYNGAQLYAASKRRLAAGVSSVPAVHFSNTALTAGGRTVPGFTVWPAAVPAGQFATANGGSEYFVSSAAAVEANPHNFTGFSNLIGVYQLSNTSSLDSSDPDPALAGALIPAEVYGVAPLAAQRPGPAPLRDCLAVTCNGLGPSSEQEGALDPSDTRPLTVWYAHGRLTMALDTVMQVAGNLRAGPAWFVINPSTAPSAARVLAQGYLGVAGTNVIDPTVATAPGGTGVMGFTLAGHAYYPTQAYIPWSPTGPTTGVAVPVPGAAPLDDFCQYNFVNCAGTTPPTAQPRYGDYAWAAYMNGAIYLAGEDVGSRCSFAQYAKDPTCGGTRSPFSNWSTRITVITP